jgi:hypothetical protein
MRRTLRAAILVLLTASGCAAAEPTASAPLPERPDVPDGWRIVTSDEGDVSATLPRDFVVVSTAGGITGYPELDASEAETWTVIGPSTHELRPNATIDDWVSESNWLTGQREGAVLAAVRRADVLLPAGPAVEFAAAYGVDGHEAWTMVYAIDIGGELSVVRFGGDGLMPDTLPGDLAVIRDLLTFPTP